MRRLSIFLIVIEKGEEGIGVARRGRGRTGIALLGEKRQATGGEAEEGRKKGGQGLTILGGALKPEKKRLVSGRKNHVPSPYTGKKKKEFREGIQNGEKNKQTSSWGEENVLALAKGRATRFEKHLATFLRKARKKRGRFFLAYPYGTTCGKEKKAVTSPPKGGASSLLPRKTATLASS